MNKSERLNDMMLFLNDKDSFQLKDLMEKYEISKSTALRDIEALERIGMPLYSQHGRNGYYGILHNRLLSPIVFQIDEVFALYFSMLTLRDYESTPFHLSLEKLKEKFERCLSTEKMEQLRKVEKVFSLASIQHNNHCIFLSDILQCSIHEKVCKITYLKNEAEKIYYIQFYNISSAYGQWYVTGYNFETSRSQVFRCDKIVNMEECTLYPSKSLEKLMETADKWFKLQDSTDFEVELSKKGVDLFYKEHYPSMNLYSEEGRYFVRGFYNKGEESFIASYLLGYRENMISIKPESLKLLIIEKLNHLRSHLAHL